VGARLRRQLRRGISAGCEVRRLGRDVRQSAEARMGSLERCSCSGTPALRRVRTAAHQPWSTMSGALPEAQDCPSAVNGSNVCSLHCCARAAIGQGPRPWAKVPPAVVLIARTLRVTARAPSRPSSRLVVFGLGAGWPRASRTRLNWWRRPRPLLPFACDDLTRAVELGVVVFGLDAVNVGVPQVALLEQQQDVAGVVVELAQLAE
jgi:hypothetical protein